MGEGVSEHGTHPGAMPERPAPTKRTRSPLAGRDVERDGLYPRRWRIFATLLTTSLAGCAPTLPVPPTPRVAPAATASSPTASSPTASSPTASVTEGQLPPTPAPALHVEGLEELVGRVLEAGDMPGCVIAVGDRKGLALLRAFGRRERGPDAPAMTTDTLFDLASLTKPLVTSLALMQLSERGQLRLDQKVSELVPGAKRVGGPVPAPTLQQLLLHSGGLAAVTPLSLHSRPLHEVWRRLVSIPPRTHPGRAFHYSDIGYLQLGRVVEAVDGRDLRRYAREEIFDPLDMQETDFLPNRALRDRVAPTEERDGVTIRGEVDDPRAYRLGGIAGHAGLFSTARDLARFARMMLSGGTLPSGQRLLQPATMKRWTRVTHLDRQARTPGWDVRSRGRSGRGHLMSPASYGHGGYTGVSLWIDPSLDLFVVLLSNRVNMGSAGRLHPFASAVSDLVVRAVREQRAPNTAVRPGIDVLREEGFARLRGAQAVLLTNASARDSHDRRSIDVLRNAPGVTLRALWSPEHGLAARLEGHVPDGEDPLSGLPVHSLFGKQRNPTRKMLHGADTIVFDLQDVGTRFYTYMASLKACMVMAAQHGLRVVVLDRPNPLGGEAVQGPVSEQSFASFVNYHPLPVRHGMTAGELARLMKRDLQLDVRLDVVRIQGWQRDQGQPETGLHWHPPSPNLRSPTQAMLYPAVGLLEGTNLSVGRGTAHPFEWLGAPFVDGTALLKQLREAQLPGVRFEAALFTPESSRHRGVPCHGVRLKLTDPGVFRPVRTALTLATILRRLHPERWDRARLPRLIANRAVVAMLEEGASVEDMEHSWQDALRAFRRRRAQVLLYQPAGPEGRRVPQR